MPHCSPKPQPRRGGLSGFDQWGRQLGHHRPQPSTWSPVIEEGLSRLVAREGSRQPGLRGKALAGHGQEEKVSSQEKPAWPGLGDGRPGPPRLSTGPEACDRYRPPPARGKEPYHRALGGGGLTGLGRHTAGGPSLPQACGPASGRSPRRRCPGSGARTGYRLCGLYTHRLREAGNLRSRRQQIRRLVRTGFLFSLCPHVAGSLGSLLQGHESPVGLHPRDPITPKAPPATTITLGVRFHHYGFWGGTRLFRT